MQEIHSLQKERPAASLHRQSCEFQDHWACLQGHAELNSKQKNMSFQNKNMDQCHKVRMEQHLEQSTLPPLCKNHF